MAMAMVSVIMCILCAAHRSLFVQKCLKMLKYGALGQDWCKDWFFNLFPKSTAPVPNQHVNCHQVTPADWWQTSPKMAKKTQVHTTSWGPASSKKPKSANQSWGKV
jgi:hypothetical protein